MIVKPLLLLLVAIMPLILICPTTGYSAALPTIITAHTTTSIDDTISTSGTTLRVQDMLEDAAAKNHSEAVFDATQLTFTGTLTITLPTTAAAWTTRNIPLRIVIRAGTSGGATSSWPTTYIKMTGVLALGSNITISGGTYDYTTQFIHLPFGLTVQDGSTLAMEGGTYRAHYPTSKYTSLVQCSGFSLTLSNHGTLSISHNILKVSDVTVSSDWWLQMLYMDNVPLTVSDSSNLTFSYNTISASNVVTTSSKVWYWFTVYLYGSAMTITDNSTLSISHSKVTASDVTAVGSLNWFTIYATKSGDLAVSYSSRLLIDYRDTTISNIVVSGGGMYQYDFHYNSPITISTNSMVSMSNAVMSVSNVKTFWDFSINAFFPYQSPTSFTTIQANSDVAISDNVVIVSSITCGNVFWWSSLVALTSPLTVTTSSRLTISNNRMEPTDIDVKRYAWWFVVHCETYHIAIFQNSTMAIDDIRLSASNVKVGVGMYWVALFSDVSSTSNTVKTFGTLSITNYHVSANNIVVGTELVWYGLYLKQTPMAISSSGTVSISNNSVSVSSVNTKQGVKWFAVYGDKYALTIDKGTLLLSNNSLTTSAVAGTVDASLVSMGGYGVNELGLASAGVCSRSSCRDPNSNWVYLCGADMSTGDSGANTQQLSFDCTIGPPTTTSSSPLSPRDGASSQESSSTGMGTSTLVAIIASVVVGFIIFVIITIVVCVCCCCWKNNINNSAQNTSNNPRRDVEMTPSTTNQQHLEYSTPYTPSDVQPVLGVPVETPVSDKGMGREVPPYGGGGCYV